MAEVFVERRYELGGSAEVVVRFARPAQDSVDFICEYEVAWPDRKKRLRAYGVDEVQALLIAMQNVHADLLTSREFGTGQLRWLESDDLGLPLSGSMTPEEFK